MIRFLLPLFLCLSAHAAFFDHWDRDSYLWREAVRTNSSDCSSSTYNTVTRLAQHLRQFGCRVPIVDACPYAGNDLNACLIRLIHDIDAPAALDNQGPFVSGDYTEATGLTGASGKFLSTRTVNMNTIGLFAHLSVYVRTASNESTCQIGGQASGTGGGAYILQSQADTTSNARINGDSVVQFGATDSAGTGFYLTSRDNTNAAFLYKNGSQLANSTTAVTTGTATTTLFVHALNNNGSPLLYTTKTLSWYSMGKALSVNLEANLYKAVQRAQSDFKRQK